jgi:hypothetical protein
MGLARGFALRPGRPQSKVGYFGVTLKPYSIPFHCPLSHVQCCAVQSSTGCFGGQQPWARAGVAIHTRTAYAQPQLWAAKFEVTKYHSPSQAKRPAKILATICLSRSRRRPVSSPTASFVTIPESDVRRDSALAARKICSSI